MGYTSYDYSARTLRASSLGYHTKSRDEVFEQQKLQMIHESMNPKGIGKRQCLDSEAHPNTVPIILGLDFTGSMLNIPHELIKDGLPTLMSKIIQKGIPDASLCFLGIGDHECDRYPLQIGQFESGDAELDMWLTRSYLEGGGGGNAGESYLLAYYFAAYHTETDAYNKRHKKGFLITIGDEPCLKSLPSSAINEVIGGSQKNYTVDELLNEASKYYNVYHINVQHRGRTDALNDWKQRLGENCINVTDYKTIPDVIADLILKHSDSYSEQNGQNTQIVDTPMVLETEDNTTPDTNIIL